MSQTILSADGTRIAHSNEQGTVEIWDAQSGKALPTIRAHVERITSMAFSADNRTLLTGSTDKTVKLWEVERGQVLRTFSGHSTGISYVAFSPDGRSVLTIESKQIARLWELDHHSLISNSCSRVFRDLSVTERQRFEITDLDPTCPQFANGLIGVSLPPPSTLTYNGPARTPLAPTVTRRPVTLPVLPTLRAVGITPLFITATLNLTPPALTQTAPPSAAPPVATTPVTVTATATPVDGMDQNNKQPSRPTLTTTLTGTP